MRSPVPAVCLTCLAVALARPPVASAPPHPRSPLDWAEELVRGLKRKDTGYDHTRLDVTWADKHKGTPYKSITDCSGFLDMLLKKAYPFVSDAYFSDWLGVRRPLAKHYYDAVVKRNRCKHLLQVRDLQPGDLIAVRYRKEDPENKDHNTGHVMLVAGPPRERKATDPIEPKTRQWEVPVIDQSRTGHGPGDTRYHKGTMHPGLGKGVLRIYTHRGGKLAGTVAGHSWSTRPSSAYYSQDRRPLVMGRLQLRPPRGR